MALNTALIAELKHEGANTRKILERVPDEHFDWKPHEKSMDLKRLAVHLPDLLVWVRRGLTMDEMDFAGMRYTPTDVRTTADLVALFDKNMAEALDLLANADDDKLHEKWIMRRGEHVIAEMPRIAVIRNLVMNHTIHHRGQLSVYLRLLDVPVPGMYGPSADEK